MKRTISSGSGSVGRRSLLGAAALAAAAGLREQFRTRPAVGAHLSVEVEVEVADLNAYDARFGTGEVA